MAPKLFLATSLLAFATASLPAQNPPAGFTYETLSDGDLWDATAMAWTPDGRLLITERQSGNIRVFVDGQLQAAPWANISSIQSGGSFTEAGLLGIAVDPAFLENGYVYVYYSFGGTENRIARLQDVNGVGANETLLTPPGSIVGQYYHNGGAMVFGNDGKLLVVTGDGLGPPNAQNLSSWGGKVLRFDVPDLTFPSDNPFPSSPVYSYGHRNHFGIAVHEATGAIVQTENGGNLMDEINRIVAGGNYGWPMVEGNETVPNPAWEDPLTFFQPTTAPTGCTFYRGDHYPASYRDAFFYCDYNQGRVHVIEFNSTVDAVLSETQFDQTTGACYGVTSGPDGNIYLLMNDTGGYGADELARYVHQNEPQHSLQLSAVSNKSLGAALTVGVHSQNGNLAVPFLSLSALPGPVATPFGSLLVAPDAVLPTLFVNNDDRAYFSAPIPNVPAFLGSSFHGQALVLTATGQFVLTNASEHVTRG